MEPRISRSKRARRITRDRTRHTRRRCSANRRYARIPSLAIRARSRARQTRHGGDLAGGSRSSGRERTRDDDRLGEISRHVGAGAELGFQHGVVVGDLHAVVGAGIRAVDVGVRAAFLDARGRVVALHFDFLDHGVEVAGVRDVRGGPVDEPAGPFDGAFAVGAEAGGPERELDAGWGLGVVVLVGGGVPGLGSLEAAQFFAVDGPFDGFGSPVDLVGVVCAEGVGSADI